MIWTKQSATRASFHELSIVPPLLPLIFVALGVGIMVGIGWKNIGAAAICGGPFVVFGILLSAFFFSLLVVTADAANGQVSIRRFALLARRRESRPARELKSIGVESKVSYAGRRRHDIHRVILRFERGEVALSDFWEGSREDFEETAARLARMLGVDGAAAHG